MLYLLLLLFSSLATAQNYRDEMFFCTAANRDYFSTVLNLIGSIFKVNYNETNAILVFDIGLTPEQINYLNSIDKVSVENVEMVHPELITPVNTVHSGKKVPGWYAWKPVIIKQALDRFPYVLYLDAGTTLVKPINAIFKHIIQCGYFFIDCGPYSIEWQATTRVKEKFNLNSTTNSWILKERGIDAGFQGLSHDLYTSYVLPMYQEAHSLYYFIDDGTTPLGFGTGRHDQTLFSVYARLLGLTVYIHDYTGTKEPITAQIDNQHISFHITWHTNYITDKTTVIRSRKDMPYHQENLACLRFKKN